MIYACKSNVSIDTMRMSNLYGGLVVSDRCNYYRGPLGELLHMSPNTTIPQYSNSSAPASLSCHRCDIERARHADSLMHGFGDNATISLSDSRLNGSSLLCT